MREELQWDPPGPGVWSTEIEHFPKPLSRIFAELFPPMTDGWARFAPRYGRAAAPVRWATVNGWLYATGEPPAALPDADAIRSAAIAERRWLADLRRWVDEERPRVVAANRGLQGEDLAGMDDDGLADHVERVLDHVRAAAPLHFDHSPARTAVLDHLRDRLIAGGHDETRLYDYLAGGSNASREPSEHVGRIVDALTAAGVRDIVSIEDLGAVAGAQVALDAYLGDYGWRLVDGYDPADAVLAEHPELILGAIRARLAGARPAPAPPAAPAGLESLVADARELYGMRDDDDGVCFLWPIGLLRRCLLELGARLVRDGALHDPADVFDAESAELLALARRERHAPSADELAARRELRRRAAAVDPPRTLGEEAGSSAPDALAPTGGGDVALTGIGIGEGRATGRACVMGPSLSTVSGIDAGDVLVAITTTSAYNSIFPIVAAVVTEEGSAWGHAAILGRELGVPTVVGVTRATQVIGDGDIVEVDAAASTVRVVERAQPSGTARANAATAR